MTLQAKKAMPDLQRYPSKLCLIWIIYQWFCFLKLIIFICGFSTKGTLRILCLHEATTVFSRCLFRLRCHGYRCKSNILNFTWRFTLKLVIHCHIQGSKIADHILKSQNTIIWKGFITLLNSMSMCPRKLPTFFNLNVFKSASKKLKLCLLKNKFLSTLDYFFL